MPETNIAAPEQETSEVEVSIEVPATQEGAAAPMAEQAEPAPDVAMTTTPAAPADLGTAGADAEVLSATVAERDALVAERDGLIGRIASIQGELSAALARLGSYDAEMSAMREKLAAYELGAALADQALPNQAAALVARLYADESRAGGSKTPGVRAWLAAAITDPNHPASALALMRASTPVDPSARPPIDIRASALTPFPRIGASRS